MIDWGFSGVYNRVLNGLSNREISIPTFPYVLIPRTLALPYSGGLMVP